MLFAAILVVALVASGRFLVAEGQSCKLTLQTDLNPMKEPLVLAVKKTQIRSHVEQLEIARPEVVNRQGVITVDSNEKLLLACPGKKNQQPATGTQTAYVKCDAGKLTVGNKRANKDTLSCSKTYADSSLRITEESCGSGDNTGVILELGYELDSGSWFPLVEICHNIAHSFSLYSSHFLYGQSIKGAIKSNERRKFTRGPKGIFSDVNPDSVYTKRGQEKALDRILGAKGSQIYITNSTFLARGHLSPDADFIYNSGQLLTYYYVNAAPQWQTFNAGNWLTIENTVRDLAAKTGETLSVHTGTYSILKLNNANGAEKTIYLEPTKKLIPVPDVYWKIVQHPVTKSCTVAVGHNNVFLTEPPTPICDSAEPGGWPTLDTLAKGYTYYCDYNNFKKTITYAPDIDCSDLLEFPGA